MTVATEVTPTLRPAGQTLNFAATTASPNFSPLVGTGNFIAIINSGAVVVAISFGLAGAASGLTFPANGTSGAFILPANMSTAIVLPMPVGATGFAAVASATTANVFVTLVN